MFWIESVSRRLDVHIAIAPPSIPIYYTPLIVRKHPSNAIFVFPKGRGQG